MSNESNDYRALVVEDDAAVRGLVVRALVDAGITCDAAADGQRGRDLIRQRDYDVVIVDLLMPQFNGHALAVEVLSLPKPPLTLVVTGVTAKKIIRDLLLRGVHDVAFKPVDYELLACKILAWLDRRRYGFRGTSAAEEPVREAAPAVAAPRGEAPVLAAPRAAAAKTTDADADYRRITVIGKVTEEELDGKLKRLSGIQPISSVALEVYNLSKSDATEVADLVSLIERDNALSVQLLRIANSAAYNRSRRRITKLDEVVVQIGRRRVGEAALAVSSMRALSANRLQWLDQQLTWLRSLAAAMAVKLLVPEAKAGVAEEGLFLGALLHLSGRIVLATVYPKQYQAIVEACGKTDATLREKEAEYFPITHAEAMSRLLACWNVPSEIHLPLKYSLLDYPSLAAIAPAVRTRALYLKVAAYLARLAIGKWEPWDTVEIPPAEVLQVLDAPAIGELIDHLRTELRDLSLLLASIEGGSAMTLPEPRRIDAQVTYCALRPASVDLFEWLAPSMGLRLEKRPCEAAGATENYLINSLDFPPSQTPNINGLAANGGKHVIVFEDSPLDAPINFARVATIPSRFGRLEHCCRDIATPR